MKKRLLALALVFTMVCTLLPLASLATGSSTGDAMSITVGESIEGELTDEVREIFYQVTLPSAGRFSFTLDGVIRVIRGKLIDSNGSSLWSEYREKNSNSGHAVVEKSLYLTEGTYYIKVDSLYYGRNYAGAYSLTTDFEAVEESFPEAGTDNDMGSANEIEFDKTYQGFLPYNVDEDQDFYKVTLPCAGRLSFTLDGAIYVIRGKLIDSNGSSLWSEYREKNSNSGHAVVEKSLYLTQGTYYIKVDSLYQGTHFTGTYSLTTGFEAVEESFPEAGTDNDMGSANEIEFDKTYQGLLPYNVDEDQDFYKVTLPSAGRLSFTLDGEIYVIRGAVIDSNGSSLLSEYRKKNSNTGHAVVEVSLDLTEGTYYIKVNSLYQSGYFSGTYSLTTSFKVVEAPSPEAEPEMITVTLKTGGGDKKVETEKGQPMKAPADPTKEGYTFGGWYTDEALKTAWSFDQKVEQSMTLYAKWTEVKPDMVTVTLKTGSGDKKVETEKGKPMKAPTEPTKEGYTFGGWYTSEALKTAWSFDQKVEQSMTLYAKWTEVKPDMVTVTLKTGDSDKTVETVKGEPMKVPTNPTKEGHTFRGWYTSEALTTAWNFDRNVDRSMTLYAKWTPVSSSATQTGKSSQTITVDGKKVELDAYTLKADSNGGDVTYVKLRDVAAVLNGTQAQFDVQWLNGAIYVVTKTSYVSQNGTELKAIATKDNSFQWNTNPILFGGVIQPLEGIILIDKNEGGHTFFKLRDLGAAIGFKVEWSAERGIYIETK